MVAIETVHTSGINIESLAVILGGFAACFALLLAWLNRREDRADKRDQATRKEITTAVENLSTVLTAKLETKEVVAGMNVRIARIEAVIGRESK
jgi:hypothetical protein